MTNTQEGKIQIGFSGVCSLVTPQHLLLITTMRTGAVAPLGVKPISVMQFHGDATSFLCQNCQSKFCFYVTSYHYEQHYKRCN